MKNVDLYDGDFTKNRLAVWFGNEARGISDEALENAAECIQIPMGGIVESLNLGTSTGIVLSYVGYQRLKYFFEKKKAKFKNNAIAREKMNSWRNFIDSHHEQ